MAAYTDEGDSGGGRNSSAPGADWQAWQESWDRQQEFYLPDREERFRVMLEMTEALAVAPGASGPSGASGPAVLDLACGTGSISARVLRRFPDARCTGVDLDPALLTIARGSFAGDERVEFVTADLTDPDWTRRLPHRSYDAVLTATALHWLRSDQLAVLYGQIADVLRDGGVFMNADHMPDETTPRINEAAHAFDKGRRERAEAEGSQDWIAWWDGLSREPAVADAVAERFRTIGNPLAGDHSDGEVQSPGRHAQLLREAGFAEARPVWSAPLDALVLGLK
ncbi:class I SAM-dependent methyltransferase [Streptomyces marispadix]|uniref:Class I SAM-dependent methyltransferase n=1 Tax=Streptomyces marispadix TaxID=2922868 RepID=A0ABS9T1Y5_9ACTN|nr:class I SAM-dependent methyltransferase [Streptomyces marispadix]MCH6162493.1 class I SAM-dependent methyltransferase [Streptomyces marispadix]